MSPEMKPRTLHNRLVRLVNKSPLITFETRFMVKYVGGKLGCNPVMIFVNPQEHKSISVPNAQYDDFLTVLKMLEKRSQNQDQLTAPSGMCAVSLNGVHVKFNLTGIWISFGQKSSFKIFDMGIRWGKPVDAYFSPEVAADRYRVGFLACQKKLAELIEDVTDYLQVIRHWEQTGEFLDTTKWVGENASRTHLFRYVGPAKDSTGVTNLSLLSEWLPGNDIKTTLCSSNTILSLIDDRQLLDGCSHSPTEWFFISLHRALSSVRSKINDGDFTPFRIELFKDAPEVVYEDRKVYNGYVALVPSARGPRLVVNYDSIPAYGKLSWILSELDLDEVIDRVESLLNFYPMNLD